MGINKIYRVGQATEDKAVIDKEVAVTHFSRGGAVFGSFLEAQ